jgi:hypothetical protein
VHQLLTNEKYVGNNVYHRTSFKLKRKHVQNPPDMWLRVKSAFPAPVSAEDFLKVQEIILARAKRYTDEEMLDRLRQILAQHGRISGLLIDEKEDAPSSAAFRHRFGSPGPCLSTHRLHPEPISVLSRLTASSARSIPRSSRRSSRSSRPSGFRSSATPPTNCSSSIANSWYPSCCPGACKPRRAATDGWFDSRNHTDRTSPIVARMDESNHTIRDYYLFPALDQVALRLRLAECNSAQLDTYRFDDLGVFYSLTERISIEDVA